MRRIHSRFEYVDELSVLTVGVHGKEFGLENTLVVGDVLVDETGWQLSEDTCEGTTVSWEDVFSQLFKLCYSPVRFVLTLD